MMVVATRRLWDVLVPTLIVQHVKGKIRTAELHAWCVQFRRITDENNKNVAVSCCIARLACPLEMLVGRWSRAAQTSSPPFPRIQTFRLCLLWSSASPRGLWCKIWNMQTEHSKIMSVLKPPQSASRWTLSEPCGISKFTNVGIC